MEVKNSREFFEKALPAKFKPEKAAGFDIVAQINVTGPDGSDWIVTIKNQKLQVTEGTTPSPNLTLKVTENDFMDIINGRLSGEKAFFTGKIQFKGNIGAALKLRDAGFF